MKKVAIVYNPIKIDDLEDRKQIAATLCAQFDFEAPRWIETSQQDPGKAMGHQALEEGADLVCAMGGDGTLRFVADALRGSGVPLGIIPEGTGNLLARNLDIPLDDFEAALRIALSGEDRPIDVGVATFDGSREEVFLVITGVGTDADTMANTDSQLKKRIGWLAYGVAGFKALFRKGFKVSIDNDDDDPATHRQHASSYMVCNCGTLQGGLVLVPEALPDDGTFDILLLAPRGLFGWGAVITDIVTRHRRGHRMVRHTTSHVAHAEFSPPIEGQVDGDAVGKVRELDTRIEAGALVVRMATNEASPL